MMGSWSDLSQPSMTRFEAIRMMNNLEISNKQPISTNQNGYSTPSNFHIIRKATYSRKFMEIHLPDISKAHNSWGCIRWSRMRIPMEQNAASPRHELKISSFGTRFSGFAEAKGFLFTSHQLILCELPLYFLQD